jgi:hypothetical protein
MGGQQKDSISDIVFFQHQDGMRLKVRRHFLQCIARRETVLMEHRLSFFAHFFFLFLKGNFCDFSIFQNFIQHCFICRTSDPTVSEDAGIEPRTVATAAFGCQTL